MKIRVAKIQEFKKLWQYSNSPTYNYFINQLNRNNVEFWTIELSDSLIGELYVFWDSEDKDEANGIDRAYLCAFRIEKSHQGHGFGKKLMSAVLERVKSQGYKEVTIGIDNNNFAKLKTMYEKMGFINQIKFTNVDYHYRDFKGKPTIYKEPYMLKMKVL
ncbi:GNAT family N-acetyltransferase [Mycoplasmatota bacterium WC30]